MRKRKLPKTSRKIYALLQERADELGAVSISRPQLARWIQCSETGARKSLRRLEQEGLIEIEHNCGLGGQILTNTYYVRKEG